MHHWHDALHPGTQVPARGTRLQTALKVLQVLQVHDTDAHARSHDAIKVESKTTSTVSPSRAAVHFGTPESRSNLARHMSSNRKYTSEETHERAPEL